MHDTLYISSVFIAGILSFLSPCILPVLPVYIAYFTEPITDTSQQQKHTYRKSLINVSTIKAVLFVSGLSTSFILLGFGAGALGKLIYSRWFLMVCGLIVIILGVYQTGLFQVGILAREKKLKLRRSGTSDFIGAYLLGFTFSFGWTPCVGPVLAAVLGLSASKGSAAYGGFLMLIYSLGLIIPFLMVAIFSDFLLTRIKVLYQHMKIIKMISGILIIIMGLLLMTNQITQISAILNRWIG